MKVADLYAELGFRVDKASERKIVESFKRTGKKLQTEADRVEAAIQKSMTDSRVRGEITRRRIAMDNRRKLAYKLAGKNLLGDGETSRGMRVPGKKGAIRTALGRNVGGIGGGMIGGAIGAAASFTEFTGDGRAAIDNLKTFGKVAVASSADINEIALAGGSLSTSFGIAANDMEEAFAVLVQGGKEGRVELKNMASELPSLSAMYTSFADSKGVDGLRDFNALFQVAARGFGNASEAATGFQGAMTSMLRPQNAKKFKKLGISIRDNEGNLRNIRDIAVEVGEKLNSKEISESDLIDATGRVEAGKFFLAIAQNLPFLDELRKKMEGVTDVTADFEKRSDSAAFRAKKAWIQVKNALIDAFAAIGPMVASIMEKVATAVSFLAASINEISELGGMDTLLSNPEKRAGPEWEGTNNPFKKVWRIAAGTNIENQRSQGFHELKASREQSSLNTLKQVAGRGNLGAFGDLIGNLTTARTRAFSQVAGRQAVAGQTIGGSKIEAHITVKADTHDENRIASAVKRTLDATLREAAAGGVE